MSDEKESKDVRRGGYFRSESNLRPLQKAATFFSTRKISSLLALTTVFVFQHALPSHKLQDLTDLNQNGARAVPFWSLKLRDFLVFST